MGTQAYTPRAKTSPTDIYPLVMYARSIQKNTADLTASDQRRFLRWLWKVEPYKHKLWVPPIGPGYFKRA